MSLYPVEFSDQERDLLWALMDFPTELTDLTCTLRVRATGTPGLTFWPGQYVSVGTLAHYGLGCVTNGYLHVQGRVLPAAAYRAALRAWSKQASMSGGGAPPAVIQDVQRAALQETAFTTLLKKVEIIRKELRSAELNSRYVDQGVASFLVPRPPLTPRQISEELGAWLGAAVQGRHLVSLGSRPETRLSVLTVSDPSGRTVYRDSSLRARQEVPQLLTFAQNRARHAEQRRQHVSLRKQELITVLPLHP